MDAFDSIGGSPSQAHTPLPGGSDLEHEAEIRLASYLNSVPYKCEDNDAMQQKLHFLVGRIILCAQSRDWKSLSTWIGVFQCWLALKYPLPKSMRVHLVKLCYELVTMPGADMNMVHTWADLLQRLLGPKSGSRPKLAPTDVVLDWRTLWRVLQKELWPKKSITSSTRNAINLFLYVAEKSRRHFPSSEIPAMLDMFLPLITKTNASIMVPTIVSFLPHARADLYLPMIFKLWEAINSSAIDDRIIELLAQLAEERVTSKPEDVAQCDWTSFKEVGVFSMEQWTIIVNKCLGSFHVPIGSMKGPSNTSLYADSDSARSPNKPKKTINRLHYLAQIFVYSMAIDTSPVSENERTFSGSYTLSALDRIIMSTESFFHPSNSGPWTLALTSFVKYLVSEFLRRWKDEELPSCHTAITRRLTKDIRKSFVRTLRTPLLLAMFSKDPVSASLAQVALRGLAILEPQLIMPQIVERAAEGLEVINETHRTTAVLSTLAAVALPLVKEDIWFGGQVHLLTLLDLALPGIDMNDPHKTAVTALFISSVASQMKLGHVAPIVGPVTDDVLLAGGVLDAAPSRDSEQPTLSKSETRQLVRDATFGLEEWVTAFFRQVFKLYENLPEEGGKSNKAGGKTEDAMLSSVKSALDMVCQHLSDELFDLVLRQTYDYASTTARANSIRAFSQLMSSLSRVEPEKTLDLFLPLCAKKIEEELEHGASSIRTTTSHSANPTDTVFHWYLTILRACLGYGGKTILKHKIIIMDLLMCLTRHAKNERGYSGASRLLTRLLHNIGAVYPVDERFVNKIEWESQEFAEDHFLHWGKLYKAEDVKITWHVPSHEEIAFVLEILENIGSNSLNLLESLVSNVHSWDSIARNDFCRHLQFVRSIWNGLSTFIRETGKQIPPDDVDENLDMVELLSSSGQLNVEAGFTLADEMDSRYQLALKHRLRLSNFLHIAAVALRQSGAQDHIDATIQLAKTIDVQLLEYGITRSTYLASAKAYQSKRDGHRLWEKQKQFPRSVYYRRAQYYHHSRLYMHSLFRGRTTLDNHLIDDLVEMALSQYTRVRKYGQATLLTVCSTYARSTRYCLPRLLSALTPGTDPDRMKGALYTLGNKSIVSYALADHVHMREFTLSLLNCWHQDKTSIQDLVKAVISACTSYISEECLYTDASPLTPDTFNRLIWTVIDDFPACMTSDSLLSRAQRIASLRAERREQLYDSVVQGIVDIVNRPEVHWKYVQHSLRLLFALLRRNKIPTDDCTRLLIQHCVNPEMATRSYCQRAITLLLVHVKMRTYSSSPQALWLEELKHPAIFELPIPDSESFLMAIQEGVGSCNATSLHNKFVDKIETGYLVWGPSIKAYSETVNTVFEWEHRSRSTLQTIDNCLLDPSWFKQLAALWGQESNRSHSSADIRSDNFQFVKMIAKLFGDKHLEIVLPIMGQLCVDSDKFKQRAGAEMLLGYLRGSKHWAAESHRKLMAWLMERVPIIFGLIKPDTRNLWDSFFHLALMDRDPRRLRPIVDWIFSLPIDFRSDSAFTIGKTLALVTNTAESLNLRFQKRADEYLALLFDQCDSSFAEIREQIALSIEGLSYIKRQPGYKSSSQLLQACATESDPLHIRSVSHLDRIQRFAQDLPRLRPQRLPPPRVSQSEYDRTSLTLMQWFWNAGHGPSAPTIFPYVTLLLPEIFHMTELSDNAELVKYSTAVLFILPSITPLPDFVETISRIAIEVMKTSQSWRVRQNTLLFLLVFFYRNMASFSTASINQILDVFIHGLKDENLEVRNTAAKVFAGVLRCSQRSQIPALRERFLDQERSIRLPKKSESNYAEALLDLHSAILGLCALVECFPYVVEVWIPPLMEVFARHSADRPPISTTIRSMASEFKKTHQDTWQTDKLAFSEDELQALNTILVGTSYYA